TSFGINAFSRLPQTLEVRALVDTMESRYQRSASVKERGGSLRPNATAGTNLSTLPQHWEAVTTISVGTSFQVS
ncbi:hypothetical protein, partial [Paraburkholderia sp. RL17-373-BIF-A]|uniref:hypothetical protein n=1 Tax=Paraburkholderia sp. RL17-373-BIF-A TaxID=3031629 RepID=UPI0038BD0889